MITKKWKQMMTHVSRNTMTSNTNTLYINMHNEAAINNPGPSNPEITLIQTKLSVSILYSISIVNTLRIFCI